MFGSRRSSNASSKKGDVAPDQPATPKAPAKARSVSRSSSIRSGASDSQSHHDDHGHHSHHSDRPVEDLSQPLPATLGHLSEEQQNALDDLRSRVKGKAVYPQDWEDATLVRFLRARKFDVAAAQEQYEAFLKWEEETDIHATYDSFDADVYEEARRVYPMWTGRFDRRGIPVYVYKISALSSDIMHKIVPSDEESRRLIAVFTTAMTSFSLPFASSLGLPSTPSDSTPEKEDPSRYLRPFPETPITSTNSIIDISGVGLSKFWSLRSHLQTASSVATANFPETIGRVFVLGAPSFFPTVWGWVKKWFDQGTVDKIFILSSRDVLPTLEGFMPIESIPREYGGNLDWTYGDDPNLSKEALDAVGGEWIRGSLRFEDGKTVIKGSLHGKLRSGAVDSSTKLTTEFKRESEDGKTLVEEAPAKATTITATTPAAVFVPAGSGAIDIPDKINSLAVDPVQDSLASLKLGGGAETADQVGVPVA